MLNRLSQMLVAGLILSGIVEAAEVSVAPGNGTLAAAVIAATDGDTLVLSDGTYLGNGDLVIDKTLTIRAINSAVASMIVGGTFTIDAAGSQVSLQGLDFGVQVTVTAAADVKVLESNFFSGVDLNVTGYATTDGDGTLMVIGNFFSPGSLITTINAYDAYIAGNTFESGYLISNVAVWVVGNFIRGTGNTDVIHINTTGAARVLANRVYLNVGVTGTDSLDGIEITAGSALIAGNIVKISSAYGSGGYYRRGIYATSSTYARVFNNTLDTVGNSSTNQATNNYGILAYGEVSGNMVINLKSSGNWYGYRAIAGTGIENNLCYNNYSNTCGNNPVILDPLLVDREDYQLGTGSPAIDTGSVNPIFADLDRTRNDIGAQGGPWSIAQYDTQRDPLYFGPYVYPIFEANAGFVDGQLQIRAIGVARLR